MTSQHNDAHAKPWRLSSVVGSPSGDRRKTRTSEDCIAHAGRWGQMYSVSVPVFTIVIPSTVGGGV
jgi:hypothetical protein